MVGRRETQSHPGISGSALPEPEGDSADFYSGLTPIEQFQICFLVLTYSENVIFGIRGEVSAKRQIRE